MTFSPNDPQPDYSDDAPATLFPGAPDNWVPWRGTVYEEQPDESESAEETYRLALESAQRWMNNYRLSPAMRLRALRSVVQSALSDA